MGAVHALGSSISHAFSGVTGLFSKTFDAIAGLPGQMAVAIAQALFDRAASWAGDGAVYLLGGLGSEMSATTRPEIGTSYFTHELGVMVVLGAAVATPLLMLTAIQAVMQQDAGLLVRAVLVKLPLALVFTGVAMQLVTLGMAATDAVSSALMRAASVPAGHVFTGLAKAIGGMVVLSAPTVRGLAVPVFATFTIAVAVAFGALVLWLELALRAASIEAATLFLPLALVGVIWPATSHWARRLGETLAALILSKVVVVAVLALAVGEVASVGTGGLSAVVSGIALLLLAVLSPYAVFRLVPMMEAGAVGHLQGLAGHHAIRAGQGAVSSLTGPVKSSETSGGHALGQTGESSNAPTQAQLDEADGETSSGDFASDAVAQARVAERASRQAAAVGLDPSTGAGTGTGTRTGASAGPTAGGPDVGSPGGGAGGAGAGGGSSTTAGAAPAAGGAAGVAAAGGVAAVRAGAGAAAGVAQGGGSGGIAAAPAGDGGHGGIAPSPYERQGSWPPPVSGMDGHVGEGGSDGDRA